MPTAVKMQEEYGDDITVLFVESQGAKEDEMEKFALSKKWIGERGIWTLERPFDTGAGGLPNYALLGNDGSVLMMGHPMSDHSKIEEAIAEQLKLAKKGSKDLPAAVNAQFAAFEKGNYAAAIKALDAMSEGADAEAARKVSATLEARAKAMVSRLGWLVDSAEFEQADKLAAQLAKGLAGHATLEPKVKEIATSLAAKEMAAEREAAKAFARVQKKIAKDGIDESVLKQLKSVGEKFPETRAAKRAAHMSKVLGA